VFRIEEIKSALAVLAHPDDVDFSAAGLVAQLTDAGAEVTYCLVSDGQAGGFDRSIERTAMACPPSQA
jgi:LmbE family N-acetylglucosaminyl deacetylase